MTLKDIAEILEVSQSEIASAVGISKTTVNNYIYGNFANREKLDSIYRYLNSREFYNGYSFMPTKQFAKFVKEEILSVFEKSMKLNDIAKAIGMSPQKLSKLKKCPDISGNTQKLDVYEQYNILEKFYNMCFDIAPEELDYYRDDNFKITNEYVLLRVKLSRYLYMFDDSRIKNSYASLLNEIIDKGFRAQLYSVLKEVCKIDDLNDYKRLIQDNEFIMDPDARYYIIYALDNKIKGFSSELHEKFEDILMAWQFREEYEREGKEKDISPVEYTPLYKYSNILCRVILDHYYAFIDDPRYNLINQYEKDSFERNYAIWHHSQNIQNAKKRVHMVEEYHNLSVNDKVSVCKEFAGKISEHMKQTSVEITPLKAEFDENGKLIINLNCIYCRQLSDINDIIEIVNRIGPLENLRTNFENVPIEDEYPFDNREHSLSLLPDINSYNYEDLEEIFDKKLEFDAMDWNLWGLLTQALYIGCSINDIYEYIIKLKKDIKHDFSITP